MPQPRRMYLFHVVKLYWTFVYLKYFFLYRTPTESTSHGIHEISFLWYTAVGSVGTVLGSLLATLYFGRQDPRVVDKELISPVLRKFWYGKYESVASEEKNNFNLHESETQLKLEQP